VRSSPPARTSWCSASARRRTPRSSARWRFGQRSERPLGSILFLGAGPTWNPALLQTAAAPALIGLYTNVSPWEDFTGPRSVTQAMRDAFGDNAPINQGYAAGWVWQYPIQALLEAGAVER
jgi:hypothetical protein